MEIIPGEIKSKYVTRATLHLNFPTNGKALRKDPDKLEAKKKEYREAKEAAADRFDHYAKTGEQPGAGASSAAAPDPEVAKKIQAMEETIEGLEETNEQLNEVLNSHGEIFKETSKRITGLEKDNEKKAKAIETLTTSEKESTGILKNMNKSMDRMEADIKKLKTVK